VKKILLGYELRTGKAVEIPLHHLVVTGVTQLSGKTTTLEALIARSGMDAIAFRTKRGESEFEGARRIRPFFRERADWQYVAALLEATMREKMKFERAWIIRVCKGARELRQVLANVERALETAKGLSESVYTTLKAYLEIVLPELEHVAFDRELRLGDGVHVMDLEGLRVEVQSLVIASTLEELHAKARDTIVVIPEAWKFAPEGRGNPVKRSAEQLIREGAAIGLLLWFDSQDLAGVDKSLLKQVDNWILGRQKEINEVEHTLAQIPLPKRLRPAPEEIMHLKVGHFIACYDDVVERVYVRPAWLPEKTAIGIARGELTVQDARKIAAVHTRTHQEVDTTDAQERMRYDSEIAQLRKQVEKWENAANTFLTDERAIRRERDQLREDLARYKKIAEDKLAKKDWVPVGNPTPPPTPQNTDPVLLRVRQEASELEVHVDRPVVQASDEDYRGRIALLLVDGFFKNARTAGEAMTEITSRFAVKSGGALSVGVYRELDWFTAKAFLRSEGEKGSRKWIATDGVKDRIRTS
jgi:hypothetical protein